MNTSLTLVAGMRTKQQSPDFQQHSAVTDGFSKPRILPFIRAKENINVPFQENYPPRRELNT